jgi:hypothetical protein
MSFEVNRRLVARRPPLPTAASVDPVTAGIIRGAFETICFEVATHLGRCASSATSHRSASRTLMFWSRADDKYHGLIDLCSVRPKLLQG